MNNNETSNRISQQRVWTGKANRMPEKMVLPKGPLQLRDWLLCLLYPELSLTLFTTGEQIKQVT